MRYEKESKILWIGICNEILCYTFEIRIANTMSRELYNAIYDLVDNMTSSSFSCDNADHFLDQAISSLSLGADDFARGI